ncbi:MAG: 16S rRNA (adenine(1518)-N(6)/adenine(1519)-N(6))-dimethyltransferase RsmA [Candidatus Thorarchaeota archaeon]
MRSLTAERIRYMLQKYSVTPDRKLGQSFLADPSTAREIVETSKLDRKTSVLEIGGGLGVLSEMIARVSKRVHVIEVDPGLVRALRDVLDEYDNVEIIHGNALDVDLPQVDRIVSNLPYSISSPITFRLLNEMDFEFAVLMYQSEFAERLLAEPGSQNYSRLSVGIQYLARVVEVLHVPAESFYPIPAVDSKVVRIEPRTDGTFAQEKEVFFWVVHGIYSYPNKQVRKALGIWFKNLGHDKDLADEVIRRSSDTLSGTDRLRNLDQVAIVRVADTVYDLIKDGTLADPRGLSE